MSEHLHVLAKDPLRLGWRCGFEGCGFFKPAGEFDGIAILPDEPAGCRVSAGRI
ncbi:hypothetical protein [Streptomyces sp. NBC_01483]|uniref:hypothetical protein n=1 Tax=Streptomyces sp. NBC_01483 TaxID=2903883 RepID=UPI002E306735|nr:hypothetical protein [Streptomyces sp. NBC_01483]